MASFPYPVSGIITTADASNPSGAKVIMRDDRTGEKINTITDSSGKYLLDAANLASGYMNTDRLTIICAYGDEINESSFLISSYGGGHTVDLTLATIAESSDTTYCTIQDVLDELGDKTTDDIGYERIRKIILRAEKEIDDRSGVVFKTTTATDEIHDYNQYTAYRSPESLYFPREGGYGSYGRGDSISGFAGNDTIQLSHKPIITITSLYKNTAGDYQTDSWTELTEQEGSGGDFIVYTGLGLIKFVNSSPYYGKRKIKVTYTYGYATVPATIERLTILLSIRDVITSKRTEAQFDGSQGINLGGEINISKFDSPTYFNWLNEEIERLWKIVGDMDVKV